MGIKELIELIVETTLEGDCPIFTFIIKDGNASLTLHQSFGVDDAVSFLFDCDMKLWELMYYDVSYKTFWHITLRDTTHDKKMKKVSETPSVFIRKIVN